MAHWRVALHALDRTGPPILGLHLVRWILDNAPDDTLDIVAFRGGELRSDASGLAPLRVLLHDHEAWDVAEPPADRVAEMERDAGTLPDADATLLVSVSAGQAIDILAPHGDAVVAWVVEQGEDLHWIDEVSGLVPAVDRWVGGSAGSCVEIAARLGLDGVDLVPEFIAMPTTPDAGDVAECRRALGAGEGDLVVMGAGIGTFRKAPDLFVEASAAALRAGMSAARFVWVGGENDDLLPLVKADASVLGFDEIRFVDSVADVTPWFAAADIFLHPARLDAFPLVCLHAAALGTPVVAFSGAGGVPQMMGDTFCGAPYPDVSGLAAAVKSLGDPVERGRLGRRQRDRVRSRYSVDAGAPRMLEVLREVVARPADRSAPT